MESKMWRILLPLLFSLANQASALEHTVVQKSPNQLQFECSKYLSPEDVACNHRCLGLVGRFWNDSTGMVSQTNARYFRPNYGQDYLGRTRQCLRENVKTLPRCASCLRADTGLKCYENNFGQLLVEVPQFVPVTEVEITQTFWVCAQMLQISLDRLSQISMEGYNKTPEGRCLMRCFLIRAGFYNDCQGPNIERFAVQADGYTADYERSVANCYARLKQEQLDSCSLATRVLDECIQNNQFSYNNVVGDLLA